jgi:hypothetical protein
VSAALQRAPPHHSHLQCLTTCKRFHCSHRQGTCNPELTPNREPTQFGHGAPFLIWLCFAAGWPKFKELGVDESYLPIWLQSLGYNTYYTGRCGIKTCRQHQICSMPRLVME